MRKLIKILATLAVAILVAVTLTHVRPKVPRSALAIASNETQHCEAPPLPVYPKTAYQRRIAANDYLAYAVASLNVYSNGQPKGFTLDKHSPEWKQVGTWDRSGLAFRVYHREEANRLTVLTVLRGTESLDASDWLANASWLLAWLPISTEYDEARLVFQATRKQAYAAAKGRKVSFITAGHSLGGGIAKHIAYSYPCVSAAVFNSSVVSNQFRLAEPYDKALIVHTYEDLDPLTRLQRIFMAEPDTETYRHYRQDAVSNKQEFQHSMTGLAVGMARQVLTCQEKRAECPVPASDTRARRLYCQSWGKDNPRCKSP
ncbi:MAG: hypothetical protein ACKVP7_00875 [Hyphomicrobiaceae bacterium]